MSVYIKVTIDRCDAEGQRARNFIGKGELDEIDTMLNVLIVDDDKLIREDIKLLLDWQKHGFCIAGEANNGREALTIIDTNKIDVIITDIYMPILNGIDLIKKIRADQPDIKVLVISNYDDFSYVKEAMKLGASDYILKYEIDRTNLMTILQNFKKQIADENKRRDNANHLLVLNEQAKLFLLEQFWKNLLEEKLQKSELDEQADKLEIEIKDSNFTLLLVDLYYKYISITDDDKLIKSRYKDECMQAIGKALQDEANSHIIPISDDRWAVLLNYTEKSHAYLRNAGIAAAGKLQKSIKSLCDYDIVITMAGMGLSVAALPASYSKAERASEDKFYRGLNTVIDIAGFVDFNSKIEYEALEVHKKKIIHEISVNNKPGAIAGISEYFSIIGKNRYYPELTYNYYIELLVDIHKQAREKCIDGIEINNNTFIPYKKFSCFYTLKNIESYFIQLTENIFKFSIKPSKQPCRHETLKALEHINSFYMHDLTLNEVAEHVGLSKNYFCRIFKEDIGENFIDYVNRLRVEKAKIIIESTNCRIQELAYKVGIKDYRYFCRVFKNITGQSPNEYRKLNGTLL
jgi:two-component system, response regulator YesN